MIVKLAAFDGNLRFILRHEQRTGARLHGGDLTLVRSENDWTEFEARFHIAKADPVTTG